MYSCAWIEGYEEKAMRELPHKLFFLYSLLIPPIILFFLAISND